MSKEELRAEMIRHKDTNETLADYLGISAAEQRAFFTEYFLLHKTQGRAAQDEHEVFL